ncbi:class I SAM-dependent methyltransferase [Nakamurella flavida]|uniref:Class I SAM-dependent methyltransferase n=1 Tax=Nakamurella flavida TaxID=363630 RepID=A0A939C4X4_9ACTN|nr:class I SAM-dependent methyltransferase [Nakamurella flavida]MBM9476189.1 class I SAM-dependent methyltransferase [Nakamurella flavida]MDP9777066.1 hypothetical protein [Nakamurella flavida]
MSYDFSLDDVAFLTGPAGERAMVGARDLPLTDATLIADLSRLRRDVGERAAPVAETIRLRRRAQLKLGDLAADWLFTDEALQQASPLPVARHRADRLAGVPVHDVTCSIGTELITLAATSPVVVGSDVDPVRLAMARHNLDRTSGAEGVLLVRADARTRTTRGLLPYADPGRRGGGRRITTVDTLPPVADLEAAWTGRPPVLRLPPGVDYDALDRPGEVEVVSLDGAVREAVLWPVELATVRRRASVLTSDGPGWQIDTDEPDDVPVGPPGRWIVDPDGAVVRAHLVRHYAFRHGLWQLDSHLAYLTGNTPPPGTRAFEVLDTAPFTERTVAGWCRRDGVGTLEIKQRGTAVVPDALRVRLRPALKGPTTTAATLVVARVGRSTQAYWCRAHAA